MAFTDSFPISATGYASDGSTGNTNCANQAQNLLTDNGTSATIKRLSEPSGVFIAGACYAPSIMEVTRFEDITIPAGATITGVRFTIECHGVLDNNATGIQYQISTDNAASFTSAAGLDVTGMNNPKGAQQEFHTTSTTTELHGLSWPTSDSDYDSPQVRFRFTINSGESTGNGIVADFIKLRVYYSLAPTRGTYNNDEAELSMKKGTLQLNEGIMELK